MAATRAPEKAATGESPRPSLSPRGLRSRAAIVDAAATMMRHSGVASTSLDDVLAAAGCGKSQAYAMKTRMTEAVARELRGRDGADSPAFGRILLSVSAAHLPREVRGGLGADA